MKSITSARRHTAAAATIVGFSFFALASGGSRSSSSGDAGATKITSAEAPKDRKLVGSCDSSEDYHLSCFEFFAPSDPKKEKAQCTGRWRESGCPKLKATVQCFQGTTGVYYYEGAKRKPEASECPLGYRDLAKDPILKASTSPASCDGIARDSTCAQYSAVTALTEKSCLDRGAELVQPAKPCPTSNQLTATQMTLSDGTEETETYYSTPYPSEKGPQTWDKLEVAALCSLGKTCKVIPVASAAPPAASTAEAPKKGGGAPAKGAKAKK